MPPRNHKPGYRYGLIVNQEKYPVVVHKPGKTYRTTMGALFFNTHCGAGTNQGLRTNDDRRSYIQIQTRLLDAAATVYCRNCW